MDVTVEDARSIRSDSIGRELEAPSAVSSWAWSQAA